MRLQELRKNRDKRKMGDKVFPTSLSKILICNYGRRDCIMYKAYSI
jgi:hypothetical protein